VGPTGWEIQPIQLRAANARITARWHKIMEHVLFAEADATLWHDGSHHLLVNPWVVVDQGLSDQTFFATFRHPDRNCIYEEAEVCIARGKDSPERIWCQVERYKSRGYPSGSGLYETACVVRRRCEEVSRLNECWLQELHWGSCRDQVSLPYAIWKVGFQWIGILPGKRDESPFFAFRPH
jgi:hypothetical protein